jgi:hypothetical protein
VPNLTDRRASAGMHRAGERGDQMRPAVMSHVCRKRRASIFLRIPWHVGFFVMPMISHRRSLGHQRRLQCNGTVMRTPIVLASFVGAVLITTISQAQEPPVERGRAFVQTKLRVMSCN